MAASQTMIHTSSEISEQAQIRMSLLMSSMLTDAYVYLYVQAQRMIRVVR